MYKLFSIAVLMLSILSQSWAQLQYVSVPRSGEARVERSEKSEFWVNPIFLKPSVFFTAEYATPRMNRKWWRKGQAYLPVPDTSWTYRPLYQDQQLSMMQVRPFLSPDLDLYRRIKFSEPKQSPGFFKRRLKDPELPN